MDGEPQQFTLDQSISGKYNVDYIILLLSIVMLVAITAPINCYLRDVLVVLTTVSILWLLSKKITYVL